MSTQANFGRDVQGFNAYAPAFAIDNYNTTLAANVEQHFTVPNNISTSQKYLAVFSFNPGANVWVANGSTAAVAGSSFSTTLSALNPAVRTVHAGDLLSFITADTAAFIGVSFYVIQQ